MMNNENRILTRGRLIASFLLAVAVSLALQQAWVMADDDDDDENDAPSRIVSYQGQSAIRLEKAMQEQSALRTVRLEQRSVARELRAVGEVVEITPLLEQRSRYLDLKAEKRTASASLEVSKEAVGRLSTLQSMDSNISKRELMAAKLEYERDRIRLGALETRLDASRGIMRQKWGKVLAEWAMQARSPELAALADMQEVLVLVHSPVADHAETVYINEEGDRTGARQAEYLSPATRVSANRRGYTYYYRARTGESRSGMRLYVWIPHPEQKVSGVVLPHDAVVWFNGRPWFYTRQDSEIFIKNAIGEHFVTPEGRLLQDTSLAGKEVVTAGSQMLLSEEYRVQIPDEDDL